MPSDDILGQLGSDWGTTRPRQADQVGSDHVGSVAEPVNSRNEHVPTQSGAGEYDGPPPEYYEDFDGYDEAPPEYFGPAPDAEDAPNIFAEQPSRSILNNPEDPEVISDVLLRTLAATDGHDVTEVTSLVGRVQGASDLLAVLDDDTRRAWTAIFEAITFEASLLDGVRALSFSAMPSARLFLNDQAQTLLRNVVDCSERGEAAKNPVVEIEALIEAFQAAKTRRAAMKLVKVIDDRAPSSEKMDAFRSLPAPTRVQEVTNNNWSRTAAEWDDYDEAVSGDGPDLIISSGWPTLDRAASGASEVPGVFKPGEFWVIAAGTGHGKSSGGRRLLGAGAQDLVGGWGLPHAKTILCFTEEEAPDIARAAMLRRGQPLHHLANNVVLAKVGESRLRVTQVVYDTVAAAVRWAYETGGNPREALPYLMLVDYIQGIKEPGENPDTEGVARTADLLMRGIAAFDPDMMAQISGLDFQSYTGMSWPDGIDDHRVAVVAFSQLRKEGTDVWYRAGKSSISDFAVIDENGEPCWIPQENDYAIPDRSDLRGSGVLLNHATGLIFFHRSRPNAPVIKDADGNTVGVADTRARFILAKARKSVSMPYVPMRFDSNPEGFRGQFYDDLGDRHCVVEGRMEIQDDAYQRLGDPILPRRPTRSPFQRISY